MFARTKRSGRHEYLQIVHNDRAGGKIRQRVIGTLGRLDRLRESGDLGRLLSSLSRYAEQTAVLTAHQRGELAEARTRRIGPDLVFGRLWEELGIRSVLEERLGARHFEFSVERAIYLTVLHRLFDTGSDRACEEWRHRYRVPGTRDLGLHHLYRAMAWLGEVLSEGEQAGATPFAPRTTKDVIEEALFARSRSTTGRSVVTSVVLPGHSSEHRGRPSLSSTAPTTICGRSGRWSLLWPWRPRLSPPAPSKYSEVVSKNTTSRLLNRSRPRAKSASSITSFVVRGAKGVAPACSSSLNTSPSQAIAR